MSSTRRSARSPSRRRSAGGQRRHERVHRERWGPRIAYGLTRANRMSYLVANANSSGNQGLPSPTTGLEELAEIHLPWLH
jgi:hypothetical protein